MRSSNELKHFHRFINAVDVLDSTKNEVMLWRDDDGSFEVDFRIAGKPAKARLYMTETEECGIVLFDEFRQEDSTILLTCDTPEEYIEIAQRVIAYLHKPQQ